MQQSKAWQECTHAYFVGGGESGGVWLVYKCACTYINKHTCIVFALTTTTILEHNMVIHPIHLIHRFNGEILPPVFLQCCNPILNKCNKKISSGIEFGHGRG